MVTFDVQPSVHQTHEAHGKPVRFFCVSFGRRVRSTKNVSYMGRTPDILGYSCVNVWMIVCVCVQRCECGVGNGKAVSL